MTEEQMAIISEALDHGELTSYEYDLVNRLADKENDYELTVREGGALASIKIKIDGDVESNLSFD